MRGEVSEATGRGVALDVGRAGSSMVRWDVTLLSPELTTPDAATTTTAATAAATLTQFILSPMTLVRPRGCGDRCPAGTGRVR